MGHELNKEVALRGRANVSAVMERVATMGARPLAGCLPPRIFTNQTQAAFWEPRLLVFLDRRADLQPPPEAYLVNLPIIALYNTDAPPCCMDIAIPCNREKAHSVDLMWWVLAQEVLHVRGTIFCEHPWEAMSDLRFCRDLKRLRRKNRQAAAGKAVTQEEFGCEWTAPAPEFTAAQPKVTGWSEGMHVPSVPVQWFLGEDYRAQPTTED
ncbi:small ribosomal subunit protein uS2B-like [Mirounga angustirostris]|uniref:small ribosomal subunit protein uS2B-like n=1 Tax=Mirounga angustirostris TaxID=9716 RepID=UPI00313D0A51